MHFDTHALVAGARAHWQAILWVLGVWMAVGNAAAQKWPIPPKDAPLWKRAAHFLLVNLPALGSRLQGKTIYGFRFAIPFISFTLRPGEEPPVPPVAMLIPIALLTSIILSFPGCATSATKPGATLADKFHDDEVAFKQVEADVKAQCGPKFAPIGVLAAAALSLAADISTANYIGAVEAAATALPAIIADAQALACVEKVVAADYQKLKPGAPPLTAKATAAAKSDAWAIVQICDNVTERGSALCRPITCDTDEEACLGVLLSTGRAVKVGDNLVFLDKDGEPKVVAAVVAATQ